MSLCPLSGVFNYSWAWTEQDKDDKHVIFPQQVLYLHGQHFCWRMSPLSYFPSGSPNCGFIEPPALGIQVVAFPYNRAGPPTHPTNIATLVLPRQQLWAISDSECYFICAPTVAVRIDPNKSGSQLWRPHRAKTQRAQAFRAVWVKSSRRQIRFNLDLSYGCFTNRNEIKAKCGHITWKHIDKA